MRLPDPEHVITSARQHSTELSAMYQEVTAANATAAGRPVYLRPSSFPVCSLTLLDDLLHEYDQPTNYVGDYFMSVGTTVHAVVERWAGQTKGRLWGNWQCCNLLCPDYKGDIDGQLVSRQWYHTDNKICPICKGIGEYREITIEYLGIKGHIDCILLTAAGVLVGDYKTSTKYGVGKSSFRQHAMMYPLQICSYAYMMEKVWGDHMMKKYKLRISGASLLFISRDNPFNTREWGWSRDDALDIGKRTVRQSALAWRAAKRSITQGNMNSVMKQKNCETPAYYRDKVAPYFTYDPCPLSEVCFSKKKVNEWFKDSLAIEHHNQGLLK